MYYSCGSAAPFGWDVKPRSGLRAHAFMIMRGPKRTWMTKRKSRGPETDRYPAYMYLLQTEGLHSGQHVDLGRLREEEEEFIVILIHEKIFN